MNNKTVRKKIDSDQQHFMPVIETLNRLPKDKKYKMIDVGAAERFLKKFVPSNVEYRSLDHSGKQDYVFNLDKGKMPVKSSSFDIVVCLETLEHTIFPDKVMNELIRIGKKDAIFILSMPNEYNFWMRLQYLVGIQNKFHTAFKTTSDHLHIHTPRVQDILGFFSHYLKITAVRFVWQSRTGFSNRGLKGKICLILDRVIDKLSRIKPSLFARIVIVKGNKK